MIRRVFVFCGLTLLSAVGWSQAVWSGDGPWADTGTLKSNELRWVQVPIEDWHGGLRLTVRRTASTTMTFYARKGAAPTADSFDWKQELSQGRSSTNQIVFAPGKGSQFSSGTWFFGVACKSASKYELKGVRIQTASPHEGMGAVPVADGTTFRTWAPFANAVSVAGGFSGWDAGAAKMVSEGNGIWSLHVRNVGHGDEYKFVLTNGSQTLWKRDPYSRWVTNSVGNSKVLDFRTFGWTVGGYQTPAWNETVIYEMHIGTFNDQPGGGPGTFDSAIARLDYLQDLGINAVKVMPVAEFPGDFSWGYNPSDPFAVESAYGGPEKYQEFVDEAHKRGIAVIQDVVHNHYGPTDLDLWRYDGWSQGGYGGVFFYNDGRAVTPWGHTRPDYGRGEVRQYIRDNALMWAEDFRVDGFRWDSTSNIRRTNWGDNGDGWSLLQWINNEIDARQPWKLNIAEDLQGDSWITRSTALGGAGFDSQWTPDFVHPLRSVMTTPWDADRDMNAVALAIGQNYNGNWLERVIYTESHDEVANGRARVPQEIDPGNPGSWYARKRSTLGAVLTMTSPGIPMIFQGQEILEDEWFRDTDPVDWSKETTFAGIRQMYKDLIALRRNWDGVSRGLMGPNLNLFHVNHGAKVVAFHRWDQGGSGDDVVVLVNFSNTSFDEYRIGMPRSGLWNVVFNSDWNGYSADFSNQFVADAVADGSAMHGLGQSAAFRLPAYSAVVLVQRPSDGFMGVGGSLPSGKVGRGR